MQNNLNENVHHQWLFNFFRRYGIDEQIIKNQVSANQINLLEISLQIRSHVNFEKLTAFIQEARHHVSMKNLALIISRLVLEYFHHQQGEYEKLSQFAEETFADDVWVIYQLGIAYEKIDIQRALLYIDKALTLEPQNIKILFTKAKLTENQQNYAKAVSIYKEIIKINTTLPEPFYNMGLCLIKMNKITAGLNSLDLSIKINPDFLPGYLKLAESLEKIKNYTKAEEVYQTGIQHFLENLDLQNNYALFLKRQNRLTESEKIFRHLIATAPNIAKYHGNLANILQKQLKTTEAMQHYNIALILEPEYHEARFSRSLALLLEGRYTTGWQEYETRWQLPFFNMIKTEKPLWKGEPLKGKKILIWSEQGFGDTIQMYRFLPILRHLGATTIFECREELMALFLENPVTDEINLMNTTSPQDYDFHLPMMSLPKLLNINRTNIPCSFGYLKTEKNQMIPEIDRSKLNIGIVWKGNVKYTNDANRSKSPEMFLPFFNNSRMQLYSLQYGNNPELDSFPEIRDLSGLLKNFQDTASIINNLDIVISVDTAVAHLAGAMGKTTRLLLPYYPDWRWGLNTRKNPWYDSVILYRQNKQNDWQPLFKKLLTDIENGII